MGEDVDGRVHSRAIHAFAIDAERAHAADRGTLKPRRHEQMPTRHGEEMRVRFAREQPHHHGVLRTAVIRCEQNAMPLRDGCGEAVGVFDVHRVRAVHAA